MARQRIQKILAAAGYGSRRLCEQLVLDGRIRVNGAEIRELPVLADPDTDRIEVDGKPVRSEQHVYYLLNKPAGVYCTHNDPSGRTRAVDLLVGVKERVYPVGRLEAETMGLLILTNDGELTQKLTHPRFAAPKTYHVEVAGCPSDSALQRLRKGVWLSEGRTAPARIDVLHANPKRMILEITLREGRNREIRRMLAKLGHNVRRLVRTRMGRLTIAKLPLGAFRPLTPDEVKHLRSLADRPGEPLDFAPARRVDRGRKRPARRPASARPAHPGPAPAARRTPQPRRRIILPESRGKRKD